MTFLITMMMICSIVIGAWFGYNISYLFFNWMHRRSEERLAHEVFLKNTEEIRIGIDMVRLDMEAMRKRFLPCENGVCSTGEGKTFNCVESFKDLEAQVKELGSASNPTESPV